MNNLSTITLVGSLKPSDKAILIILQQRKHGYLTNSDHHASLLFSLDNLNPL